MPSPQMDPLLFDESLAPLKRNHACLQCKKRKVKCDGIRPHCSPCLRSHAHSSRAAMRAGLDTPVISCEWAEIDCEEEEAEPKRAVTNQKKKTSFTKSPINGIRSDKDKRWEEERETLLSRIAELEARQPITPPDSNLAPSHTGSSSSMPKIGESSQDYNNMSATVNEVPEWDFSSFFVMPTGWPKNLPAPYLLEHLIDTFFQCVPSLPRLIHRANLMSRIRLPPTSPNFPHPSLLHAICARAAPHTAWVNRLPSEIFDQHVKIIIAQGGDLEQIADFGTAQAESAARSIRISNMDTECISEGALMFEMTQAQLLVAEAEILRGLFGRAWGTYGLVVRYVKGQELTNRRFVHRFKEASLGENPTPVEREERFALAWHAFVKETLQSSPSVHPSGISHKDMYCRLPASSAEFTRKDGFIMENPQYPDDPHLYTHHPVPDAFVLLCKMSLLLSRTMSFILDWDQRLHLDHSQAAGMATQEFQSILKDISAFLNTIPPTLRVIFKHLESAGQNLFNGDLLLLHIAPHVTLMILYEPFMNWSDPADPAVHTVRKSIDAAMAYLHLIPSNLDISSVMSDISGFVIFGIARFLILFMQQAAKAQQFVDTSRHRSDVSTIQNILTQLGARHPFGSFMSNMIETLFQASTGGVAPSASMKQICSRNPPRGSPLTDSPAQPQPSSANSSGSTGLTPFLNLGTPDQPNFMPDGFNLNLVTPGQNQQAPDTTTFANLLGFPPNVSPATIFDGNFGNR